MKARTTVEYILAALIVIVLGALAGWYFFLHGQSIATVSENAARGFGSQTPAGSPFGGSGGQSGTSSTSSAASTVPQTPQLWHIATAPSSGIAFATSTQGIQVTYVERSSGYVFEANPMSGQVTRLTNTLMPKIYDAVFASAYHVYERGLNNGGQIITFAGTIPSTDATTSQALLGSSLATGIEALAPDPKSGQLVYLAQSPTGAALWRSQWDGTKAKQLFSSVFSDWRLSVLSDSRLILTQKAADGVDGYAYELTVSGSLNKLLGPLAGLTVLARGNSSALLYGISSGNGLTLFAQAAASSTPVQLPVHTPADKCVWAPGSGLIAYCAVPQAPVTGNFLDAWYRGEAHSSDAIWRIDVSAGQAELFFTPEGNTSLDVVDPVMDQNGTYIAFLNGADRSPWLLRLNK